MSSLGSFTLNFITALIFGFDPPSPGCVVIGVSESSFLLETLMLFKSKEIYGFLTGRKDKGFRSLNPSAFISTVYGIVSGVMSIWLISPLCSVSII